MEENRKDRDTNLWFMERMFTKKFSHKNKQTAYLNLCKWLSSNIIVNKDELCQIAFDIKEVKGAQLPTYVFEVYVRFSESDLRGRTCEACKEYSNLFYIRGFSMPCSSCKMLAYVNRMDDEVRGKKKVYGNRLKAKLSGR